MGTWGTGLYSNDTTCDVRDIYIDSLEEKLMNNQDAYENIFRRCGDYLKNLDEEPLFWFALADTQWKIGRLMPEVKEKALEWIEKGGGVALWEESKSGSSGWRKTLEKLRTKLKTEQPKEKHYKKKYISYQNPWKLNDIYAYMIHKEYGPKEKYTMYGKYILLQKIGEAKSCYSTDTVMRIQVYDKIFDNIPSVKEITEMIRDYRLVPFSDPYNQVSRFEKNLKGELDPDYLFDERICTYDPVKMSATMEQYNNYSRYPKDKLTFICSIDGLPNIQHERADGDADRAFMWHDFHSQIGWFLSLWKDIEYDIMGDGTFEYPTLEQQKRIKALDGCRNE